MKIPKETFIEFLEARKKAEGLLDKLQEFIHSDIMDEIYATVENMVEIIAGEYSEEVLWFMYDAEFGNMNNKIELCEVSIEIKTPEDLWDYLYKFKEMELCPHTGKKCEGLHCDRKQREEE